MTEHPVRIRKAAGLNPASSTLMSGSSVGKSRGPQVRVLPGQHTTHRHLCILLTFCFNPIVIFGSCEISGYPTCRRACVLTPWKLTINVGCPACEGRAAYGDVGERSATPVIRRYGGSIPPAPSIIHIKTKFYDTDYQIYQEGRRMVSPPDGQVLRPHAHRNCTFHGIIPLPDVNVFQY